MRIISGILVTLSFFLLLASEVYAEEIKPKVSKYNTEVLFDEKRDFKSRELIIKFKSEVSSEEKGMLLTVLKMKGISHLERGDLTLVEVPGKAELTVVAEKLLKYEQVEYVEPNYRIEPQFTPSDPIYSKQWYLKKIQMPKAWDLSKGSSIITVAVVDGGVQTSHPDLKGKIIYPYDVVRRSTSIIPDDHATHVAGIIAATINKTGIAGIAPNVKIMPVSVFNGDGADIFDVVDGIYYAVDHKADIINLSLGSINYSYALDYAIHYAHTKGVTVIAAAGNDDTSTYTYPAALPSVLGVSATDTNDKITQFSNYGSYIDFSAPGMDIYSTVSGSSYRNMSGTSMAAPVVSGVAALVLSKNPFLSPEQVENILKKSSVDLGNQGWDYLYGNGRVDAYKALSSTPNPVYGLKLSMSEFTLTGLNKNTISVYAQGGTFVSIYIQNSKGTILRKLVTNKKWNGGQVTVSWDGKQENGAFVPNGIYKVVAKGTNGKKTIYKAANVKTVNKAIPSIKVTSSSQFSNAVNGKLRLTYELNMGSKVTAILYDQNKKEVKRFIYNKSLSAGRKMIIWEGKDNKGKKVHDGTYSLVMSVMDSRKGKGATRKVSIKVDSIKPVGKMSLNSSLLKMDGKAKPLAKIDLNESAYVSAYITTDKGVRVRKLKSDQIYKRGISSLYWDGKNDKGQLTSEGKFKFYVEYRDAAGNKSIMKSSIFHLQDWIKPAVKSSPNIRYQSKTKVSISYTISKPGYVTIQVVKDGKTLRTVESFSYKSKGSHSFTYDGKNQSGTYLADGQYQFKITFTDKYKQTSQYVGNIAVAYEYVEITSPSIVQFFAWEEDASEVYYHLSKSATVTVEILNSSKKKIRTISSNSLAPQGINSFKWDGFDDNGWYEFGDEYFYTIKARHSNGNETVAQGKMTNQENPPWLQTQEYSFIPDSENNRINRQLNCQISVTDSIKLSIKVYDSIYMDELLDQKEFELKPGTNSVEYVKPQNEGKYYVLEYKDSLGNVYSFDIDE